MKRCMKGTCARSHTRTPTLSVCILMAFRIQASDSTHDNAHLKPNTWEFQIQISTFTGETGILSFDPCLIQFTHIRRPIGNCDLPRVNLAVVITCEKPINLLPRPPSTRFRRPRCADPHGCCPLDCLMHRDSHRYLGSKVAGYNLHNQRQVKAYAL